MKVYKLDEVIDAAIGPLGSNSRTIFEDELKLDVLGLAIRDTRKKRNLTQSQLGALVGVKKAQISRLENNVGNITLETLLKIFHALDARLSLKVDLFDEVMVAENEAEYSQNSER